MRQGQLLATGLIYTRQKYIVLDETQKFTKTRSFELVCEILRLPIFVRVFFILSIQNLDLQNGVGCKVYFLSF